MRSSRTGSSGNISKKLNPIRRNMKLKDYVKKVRELILCYEYSTTFDLANHIVEENREYIEENFHNHVPTNDTAHQVWNRWVCPSGIEPFVNQGAT